MDLSDWKRMFQGLGLRLGRSLRSLINGPVEFLLAFGILSLGFWILLKDATSDMTVPS